MNILLWILQILLAIHTAIGAVWKFSNTAAETMPTISAISQEVWLGMSVLELLCSLGLLLPALAKSLGKLVPVAAALVAAEMLLFTGLHLNSGATDYGPVMYWLIVTALCAFIAYGRLVLKPIRHNVAGN